jgi:hypothetical protein
MKKNYFKRQILLIERFRLSITLMGINRFKHRLRTLTIVRIAIIFREKQLRFGFLPIILKSK